MHSDEVLPAIDEYLRVASPSWSSSQALLAAKPLVQEALQYQKWLKKPESELTELPGRNVSMHYIKGLLAKTGPLYWHEIQTHAHADGWKQCTPLYSLARMKREGTVVTTYSDDGTFRYRLP